MLTKWRGEKNSLQFEKCLPIDEEKRNSQRFKKCLPHDEEKIILNGLRNAYQMTREKNSLQFKKCLPNDEEKSVEIEVRFAVYLLAVVCPDDRYHAHTLNEGHHKNNLL